MQVSQRNARSSNGGKKRRRRFASFLESDKALLSIFVASAFIVSISMLIVPLTLEDTQPDHFLTTTNYEHVSIDANLPKESTAKKEVKKISSSTDHQNADAVSNTKSATGTSNSTEGYFLTHSTPYHTIFSTGCSIFQDWQSYVFFYHVFQSGQEGHVTRIASGCTGKSKVELQEMFDKEITSMRPGIHHLHQTPEYSLIKKKHSNRFKYFNKPFGVRHWMEHALGYPENHELHDDSIIILMDPDQIMLRPFTNDFTNSTELWRKPKLAKLKVEHGSPFSQQYGYGLQWLDKVNLTYIFNHSEIPSPVMSMTRNEGFNYYFAMGPVSTTTMLSVAWQNDAVDEKQTEAVPQILSNSFDVSLSFYTTSFNNAKPYVGKLIFLLWIII